MLISSSSSSSSLFFPLVNINVRKKYIGPGGARRGGSGPTAGEGRGGGPGRCRRGEKNTDIQWPDNNLVFNSAVCFFICGEADRSGRGKRSSSSSSSSSWVGDHFSVSHGQFFGV